MCCALHSELLHRIVHNVIDTVYYTAMKVKRC